MFEERLKLSGIILDYGFFMMCVFNYDTLCDQERVQSEITYSTIKKTIDDEFSGLYDYELFSRYEKFCLLLKFNTPPNLFKLNHSFEHIIQRVSKHSDMPISVGISDIYENFPPCLKNLCAP